jgi:hypothetical protein
MRVFFTRIFFFFFGKKEVSWDDISEKEINEKCQRLNRIAIVDGDRQKIIFKKEKE